MIKIEVQSTRAVLRHQEPLTVGLRGAKVYFTFGQDWDGLIKTAVFRQGEKAVAVANVSQETVIPWEVLTVPGVPVQIGVYGRDSTGEIAIPTVWATSQPVRPGTDPEADPSAEPTPGLWEQMQGQLTDLETQVDEAKRPVHVVTVWHSDEGDWQSSHTIADIQALIERRVVVKCYWYDQMINLNLAGFQSGVAYTFTAVEGAKEYCVVFRENGRISGTITPLAKNTDIPKNTSDLTNDSGFLTKAPVTSVNGQTGDVQIPTVMKVTVTQDSEGSYYTDTDVDIIQAALEENRTVVCYWYNENIVLHLVTYIPNGHYVFTAIEGAKEYCVVIRDTEDVHCTVTKLSQGAAPQSADDLSFDSTTGMLYLTCKGQIIGQGVQIGVSGGSDNNAVLTLENTTGWTTRSVEVGASCVLNFNWSSTEDGLTTGDGTLVVKVGGIEKYNKPIRQGDRSVDITEYLDLGYNLVNVTVYDIYRNSKSIAFGVTTYDMSAFTYVKLVDRSLTGEYVNDRVTTVGGNAFSGLNDIAITLPNVTSVAGGPFDSKSVDVYLPNLVNLKNRDLAYSYMHMLVAPKVVTLDYGFLTYGTIDYFDLTAIESLPNSAGTVSNLIIRNVERVATAASSGAMPQKRLYVPSAMVDAYKAATTWCDIADRIRPLEEYTLDGTITGELNLEKMESGV